MSVPVVFPVTNGERQAGGIRCNGGVATIARKGASNIESACGACTEVRLEAVTDGGVKRYASDHVSCSRRRAKAKGSAAATSKAPAAKAFTK